MGTGNATVEHPHKSSPETVESPKSLKDPGLKRELQQLRTTDNVTNWYYLGRVYLIMALFLGSSVALGQWLAESGYSPWWAVPLYLLTIVVVGASQHQLAGATHEATHHTLFKNRWLNELVSDLLCMLPLFSTTQSFRLHHLAHHQYINDPDRDPDFAQLRESGHWLKFPVSKQAFLGKLIEQLFLVGLIRYLIARIRYSALENGSNVYTKKQGSPWMTRFMLLSFLGVFIANTMINRAVPEAWRPLCLLASAVGFSSATVLFYGLMPASAFQQTRLKPVFSPRVTFIIRVTFVAVLFSTLSWVQYLTGIWIWFYYLLLWVLPIFTTFAFFMILRQLVQHGNGDRGWLTNTRVFLVNPLINYAVFPFGMDYHLPHHMFATIPHYRLPDLHRTLLKYADYREQATVVEGYFAPRTTGQTTPTVLEVLGPEYAVQEPHEVFIDESIEREWNQ